MGLITNGCTWDGTLDMEIFNTSHEGACKMSKQ